MNLTFSYNWLKEHVDYRSKPAELARLLSLSGVGVEHIRDFSKEWNKIVVGEVKSLAKHPGADKLTLAQVSIGKEEVKVVCGGINLRVGMLVALALPGARVKWHGGREEVELVETAIRGEKSFGMICASDEIGLEELLPSPAREILDLGWLKVKPGTPLAQALTNNDLWFEVEITTNRPDNLAILGMAREAAAVTKANTINKTQEQTGKILRSLLHLDKKTILPFEVKVHEPELCLRSSFCVLDNVKVGHSPMWLKWRLAAAGIRSINNIVDITNYVMLEYGQPMHVYDYDTLKGKRLEVRLARHGEKFLALDGKTYELSPNILVIADAEKAGCIAGIMGGESTGVKEKTTRLVFEAANWHPGFVRQESRLLNLRSDSLDRFEKGLAMETTILAVARAVELAQELAGAQICGPLIDIKGKSAKPKEIVFDPELANQIIGIKVATKEQVGVLERLGFRVQGSGRKFKVTVPYWRARDVQFDYDLVEEVARVYGYTNVPSVIPVGGLKGHPPSIELQLERLSKQFFKGLGLTEVYPYSLTSEKVLQPFNFDFANVLKVSNPLSEDYLYLRPSLLPSLVQITADNQEEFSSGQIFEIAKQYHSFKNNSFEDKKLGLAIWEEGDSGQSFYRLKGVLEALFKEYHLEVSFESNQDLYFHPGRQGKILVNNEVLGTFGELHQSIQQAFGLNRRVVLADLSFAILTRQAKLLPHYTPPPVFPSVKRDLAIIVSEKISYADITQAISAVDPLLKSWELFDVYRGEKVGVGKKSLALHLVFNNSQRTLTAEEVEQIMGRISATLKQKFNVVVRS